MKKGGRKELALLMVLAMLVSAIAAVGAPAGAIGARDMTDCNITIGFYDETGAQITEADLGTTVTINATLQAVGGNETGASVRILINDGEVYTTTQDLSEDNATVVSWDWDTSTYSFGDYTIMVEVAGANVTKNATAQFTLLATSFKVGEVTADKDSALIGDTVKITAKVSNEGNKDGTPVVEFYDGSNKLGEVNDTAVPAGQTKDIVFSWDTSDASEGVHVIKAQVGASSNTTGNITLIMPRPDVIIEGVSVDKNTATIGDTVKVTATLKNNGTAKAVNVSVEFYIDAETSPANTTVIAELDVGASTTAEFELDTSELQPGNHTVTVKVGEYTMTSENITVVGVPNAYVDSISAQPESVFEGDNITITVTVKNNGTADATDVKVDIYADGELLNTTYVNVSKDGTETVTYVWTTPDVSEDTNKTLKAVVGQTEVTQNVTIKAKVPNLYVDSIKITPTTIRDGDEVTVEAVVKNNGTGDATDVVVEIYDGSSKKGEGTVNVSIDGQNATNATFKISGAGNHTIYVKVKYGEEYVYEANQTINVLPALKPAAITIANFTAKPTEFKDKDKDSTQKVTLTLVLKNNGDLDGTVTVTIKEGKKTIKEENVTVPGGQEVTKTYTWKIKGEGTHKAEVEITGDVDTGGTTSKQVSVKLSYKSPGFEALVLVAAIVAAVLLLRRRK